MGFDAVYDERRRGHLGKKGNIVLDLVKLRIRFDKALLKLEAAPVTQRLICGCWAVVRKTWTLGLEP